MAKINLLPWREELAIQRNREFGALAALSAAAAVGIIVLLSLYYGTLIDNQNGRNKFMQTEIAKMDKKIESIRELKAKRERLQRRIETIQQLQTNRTEIVHLFDETAKSVPEGVYLTSIKQKGASIEMTGIADSNGLVSEFASNINKSEWMTDPQINEITRNNNTALRTSSFRVSLRQTRPDADKKEGEEQ